MIGVRSAAEFPGKLRSDTVFPHNFGNCIQVCRITPLPQFLMNPQTAVTLFDLGMNSLDLHQRHFLCCHLTVRDLAAPFVKPEVET